jgi:hypothetical protein
MLQESRAPAKESPVKAIVAAVLVVGALGFVGWRVYGMFSGPAAPPQAVEQAETRAEEMQKEAEKLPPPPPPPPQPEPTGPPTRSPKSRSGN